MIAKPHWLQEGRRRPASTLKPIATDVYLPRPILTRPTSSKARSAGSSKGQSTHRVKAIEDKANIHDKARNVVGHVVGPGLVDTEHQVAVALNLRSG